MKKPTLAVLFGGCSTEYEVSLQSACAILGHMDARQYAPLPVGITREGQWRYFPGPLFHLETGDWQDQPRACLHALSGSGRPAATSLRWPPPAL